MIVDPLSQLSAGVGTDPLPASTAPAIVEIPAEAEFAPPVAPMAMPKQLLERAPGTFRLRLPGIGRRMQGQP